VIVVVIVLILLIVVVVIVAVVVAIVVLVESAEVLQQGNKISVCSRSLHIVVDVIYTYVSNSIICGSRKLQNATQPNKIKF
jgi:hypothetical protein